MKKTKTKSKARKQKTKNYSAYILGLVLIAVLTGEYALVTNTTAADWTAGFSVLDVSSSLTTTASVAESVSQPAFFAASSINDFYKQSAVAMTQLLDFSSDENASPMEFVYGVNDFYQMATTEMANVLDLSNYAQAFNHPSVAGISISQ